MWDSWVSHCPQSSHASLYTTLWSALHKGFISRCLLSVSHFNPGMVRCWTIQYFSSSTVFHFIKSLYLFHLPVKDTLGKEYVKDRAISSSNIGGIYFLKKTVCSEYQNVEVLGYISNLYCYDIVLSFKKNSIIQHYFNLQFLKEKKCSF